MKRNFRLAGMGLICALLSIAAAPLRAQLLSAHAVGTFTADGKTFVSADFAGTVYGATGAVTGNLILAGYSGPVHANFSAPVKKVTFTALPAQASAPPGELAAITSGAFYYYDLQTNTKTLATAIAELRTGGAGTGVYFKITAYPGGGVLYDAVDATGAKMYYPLTSGSVTVRP